MLESRHLKIRENKDMTDCCCSTGRTVRRIRCRSDPSETEECRREFSSWRHDSTTRRRSREARRSNTTSTCTSSSGMLSLPLIFMLMFILMAWVPHKCHSFLAQHTFLSLSCTSTLSSRAVANIIKGTTSTARRPLTSCLDVASQQPIADFQSLTVKELRQLIKKDPRSKGLLSSLKRKQDLVSYLLQQQSLQEVQQSQQTTSIEPMLVQVVPDEDIIVSDAGKPSSPLPKLNGAVITSTNNDVDETSKTPLKMPPLNNGVHLLLDDDSDDSPSTENSPQQEETSGQPSANRARKNLLFEQILTRYPPLRELYNVNKDEAELEATRQHHNDHDNDNDNDNDIDNDNAAAAAGNTDIRQVYHPIFQSTNHVASADMDLIFVGTASCTPGVTEVSLAPLCA